MFFYARIAGYAALKPYKGKGKKQSKIKRKEQLEKICRSIGLLSGRDVDSTVVGVFHYALVKRGAFFGSTELARALCINRLTCLYHLKRMERMGIVKKKGGEYALVHSRLEEVIEDFRRSSTLVFEEMMLFARRIDAELEREHEKGQRQKESAKT